jgi:hypothetical protein
MDTQQDDRQTASRRIIDALGLSAFGYTRVFIPEVAGLDWARIAADPSTALVVTNRPSKALRFCEQGLPAIAIMGATQSAIAEWFRDRGGNVIEEAGARR